MPSGYGSQALALKYLGVDFTHHRICEWAIKSIQAYKDIHFTNDNTDYSQLCTKEQLIDYLFKKGISANYNEPMTYDQIKRLSESQLRTIYNNIITTKNLVNITQVKAKDLDVTNKEDFTYLLTYSFPCQDLSLAGKGKGMKRDSGTRSGMLWQVERILKECQNLNTLPDILLMENVPQVIGTKNIKDFQEWELFLESLGYSNYVEILNAKDYGVPQNRERAFMISILGDYKYEFPKPIELKLRLKDTLEDNVDEKYYLSDKMIKYITANNIKWTGNNDHSLVNKSIASTINTGEGSRRCDSSNYVCADLPNDFDLKLLIKEATKKGYAIAHEGDGVYINRPHQKRGVVQKQMIQTLKTSPDVGVVVKNSNLRIRKLTPKECGRLMGVRDEDIDKLTLSKSAQYHCFGDSICTTVLMAIFGQFTNLKWEEKLWNIKKYTKMEDI